MFWPENYMIINQNSEEIPLGPRQWVLARASLSWMYVICDVSHVVFAYQPDVFLLTQ